MFENIGGKIKGLAVLVCSLGMIASVLYGIVLISDAYYDMEIISGCLFIFVGPLIAWLSSCGIYGFGELIEKICGIHDMMQAKFFVKIQNSKEENGFISEEHYHVKKSQLENETNE